MQENIEIDGDFTMLEVLFYDNEVDITQNEDCIVINLEMAKQLADAIYKRIETTTKHNNAARVTNDRRTN